MPELPAETMTVDSWVSVYAGANWHERECHEMFGIGFHGHPDLRNMYLPTGFEGHPLRKDFPLLARMIKPWPGIADVMTAADVPNNAFAIFPDLRDQPVLADGYVRYRGEAIAAHIAALPAEAPRARRRSR